MPTDRRRNRPSLTLVTDTAPHHEFERRVHYGGPSMYPTLKNGDGLQIEPYERPEDIRKGDVIVFEHPTEPYDVVHRVIDVGHDFVRTRGDSNRSIDPYSIKPEDVLGRVVGRQCGNRAFPVRNGHSGMALHVFRQFMNRIRRFTGALLRPAYLGLAETGWFHGWHSRFITPRLATFRRSRGLEHQLIWRGQVIAFREPGENLWKVRVPFRLFLDLAALDEEIQKRTKKL